MRSPDRELLRRELGIDAEARVVFEASFAAPLLWLLARLPPRFTRIAAAIAKPLRFGTSGGWVEARSGNRAERIVSTDQRIAILPLVFALRRIEQIAPGVHAPSILNAEELLEFVAK